MPPVVIKQLILRMTDPMYMWQYIGFLPVIALSIKGVCLLWNAWTGDISRWLPRWLYVVGGVICLLSLPAYVIIMTRRGLL